MKYRDLKRELEDCGCKIMLTKKNRVRIFLGNIPVGNIPNFSDIADHIAKGIRKHKTDVKERGNA